MRDVGGQGASLCVRRERFRTRLKAEVRSIFAQNLPHRSGSIITATTCNSRRSFARYNLKKTRAARAEIKNPKKTRRRLAANRFSGTPRLTPGSVSGFGFGHSFGFRASGFGF